MKTLEKIKSDRAFEMIRELYYDKLGWCGCGDPAEAMKCVKEYLISISTKNYFHFSGPYLCLAYTLEAVGLTDHGGSIYGCWLTEYGKAILNCLNNIDDLEEVFIESLF